MPDFKELAKKQLAKKDEREWENLRLSEITELPSLSVQHSISEEMAEREPIEYLEYVEAEHNHHVGRNLMRVLEPDKSYLLKVKRRTGAIEPTSRLYPLITTIYLLEVGLVEVEDPYDA